MSNTTVSKIKTRPRSFSSTVDNTINKDNIKNEKTTVVKKTKTTKTNDNNTTTTKTTKTTKTKSSTSTKITDNENDYGLLLGNDGKKRCFWINKSKDETYLNYHDNEWGKENRDSIKLFEKINLEAQQAGLSWITVLKKRDEYRKCFYQFSPEKIVEKITPDVIENQLMKNQGLIRNRLKLNAIIENSKAYLKMKENGEDFATFIWSFVNNKSSVGKRITTTTTTDDDDDKTSDTTTTTTSTKPLTRNEISDEIAKQLKKKGFKFIGTTTIYAFMQSVGMINDHCKDCHFNPLNKNIN